MRVKPDPAWANGVQAVSDESGGVVTLQVLQYADLPDLLADAISGHPEAVRLADAASAALRQITGAPRRQAALCAACSRRLRGYAFNLAVVTPGIAQPTRALTLAVCFKCATSRDEVRDKATSALRAIWPGLRPIAINPAAGHA